MDKGSCPPIKAAGAADDVELAADVVAPDDNQSVDETGHDSLRAKDNESSFLRLVSLSKTSSQSRKKRTRRKTLSRFACKF